jgi:Spy/CpxP family protein refolding chaperone
MSSTIKRFGRSLGVAALAALMAGVGYQNISAQGPGRPGGRFGGPGGPGGPRGALGPLLGQLNLTSDQQSAVTQILASHHDAQQALGQRAMAAEQALQAAITAGIFDEGTIRGRAADVAAVNADVAVARGQIFGEVYQILTPDQQNTLKQLQANMQNRMQQAQQNRQNRHGQQP